MIIEYARKRISFFLSVAISCETLSAASASNAYATDSHQIQTVSRQLSITQNPFKYSDYFSDPESGLDYLKARYYSPGYQVFTSRDTCDLPDRYGYCDSNPVISTDTDGHDAKDWLDDHKDMLLGSSILLGGLTGCLLRGCRIGMNHYIADLSKETVKKTCSAVKAKWEPLLDKIKISRPGYFIWPAASTGVITITNIVLILNSGPADDNENTLNVLRILTVLAGSGIANFIGQKSTDTIINRLFSENSRISRLSLSLKENAVKAANETEHMIRGGFLSRWEAKYLEERCKSRLAAVRRSASTWNDIFSPKRVYKYLYGNELTDRFRFSVTTRHAYWMQFGDDSGISMPSLSKK